MIFLHFFLPLESVAFEFSVQLREFFIPFDFHGATVCSIFAKLNRTAKAEKLGA